MYIRYIRLQNIKVHRDREFDFKPGLNVIVGENGSGKSTILDAITLLLTGETPKKGLSLGDFLTRGESKGAMEIGIELDGRLLSISRKGSGLAHFSLKENGKEIVRGKSDVYRILWGSSFERVRDSLEFVYAVQNAITRPFRREKNAIRELERFLGLDVYREIAERKLKPVSDFYRGERGRLEGELKAISDTLAESDLNGMRDSLYEKTRILESLKLKGERLEGEEARLQKEIDRIEESLRRMEGLRSRLEEKEQAYEKQLGLFLDALDTGKRYLSLKESLESLEFSMEVFKKVKREYEGSLELKSRLEGLKVEIRGKEETLEILRQELEEGKKRLEEGKRKIEATHGKLEDLNDRLKRESAESRRLEASIERKAEHLLSLKGELEELKAVYDKFLDLKGKVDELVSLRKKVEQTRSRLRDVENAIAEIGDIKSKIRDVESALSALYERISLWKRYEKDLADGICPFFNEFCLNVMGKKKGIDFGMEELSREENALKESLAKLKAAEREFDRLYEERAGLERLLLSYSARFSELEEAERRFSQLIKRFEGDPKEFLESKEREWGELSSSLNELQKDAALKRSSLEVLAGSYEELKRDYERLLRELESERKNLESKRGRALSAKRELDELNKHLESLSFDEEKFDILYKTFRELEEKRLRFERTRSQMNGLGNVDSLLKERWESFLKEAGDIVELRFEIRRLSAMRGKSDRDEMRKALESIRDKRRSLVSERSRLESEVATLKREIERAERIRKRYEETAGKLEYLSRKSELFSTFRSRVAAMGTLMFERMLERIAVFASRFLNSISGKDEEILWKLGDDTLDLRLRKEDGTSVPFHLLSGGEQISIALALRIILLKFVETMPIMLLDEPTVNLDDRRVPNLVESFPSYFNGLDQIFVVTHERMFETLPAHVITL